MASSTTLSNSLSSLTFSAPLRPPPQASQLLFPPSTTPSLSRTIKFHNHLSPVNSLESTSLICKAKAGAYNIEVVPEEDEDVESLIIRWRREVSRARIIPEIKRRRYHETSLEKRKRKSMEAAKKYGSGSRRRFLARMEEEEKLKLEKEKEETGDAADIDEYEKENWDEDVAGQVPYCRS